MDTSIKRYPAKEHHQPVERICRTLELRDDPQLIAEYRRRHSQGAIWPEIPAGIREAGILEMEIYLLDTRPVPQPPRNGNRWSVFSTFMTNPSQRNNYHEEQH